MSTSEDIPARYRAAGWHTTNCDGHDPADIARAIDEALADDRPSLVACKTIIGKGAPTKQGTSATHGSALGAEEVAAARLMLGWEYPAFEVPDDILSDWRSTGERGKKAHSEWKERASSHSQYDEFMRRMNGDIPSGNAAGDAFKAMLAENQKVATRKASEIALGVLTPLLPEMIGGSADLTGSNNTKTAATGPLTAENYAGRYVYYGIREFGMAAAMNGMALHGGVIPYGGTFLVFTDYCRAAIRLSAIQEARVVYVKTHDTIGLGEDGPTHQPVEHLQSLRAMPGVKVFRPCDIIETAEAWNLALQQQGPSILALSRQNLPQLRHEGEMLSAKGGYRLAAAEAKRQVVLIATGSEVELAMNVRAALEEQGIGADVVSMACTELFDEQDKAYRADILPADALKVSIEAGTTFGWERYTGTDGVNIGLDRFGASAPAEVLYPHFGFSVEAIVPKITAKLNG